MSQSIKTVMVIGASGSVGQPIVDALLAANFTVSVLTRESSTRTFPSTVKVHPTDYSEASLLKAFHGIGAIVSTIATFSTFLQNAIISTAIAAGVKRFIPSEYGIDTSLPSIPALLPPAAPKQETVAYLKGRETEIEWTAICVGAFFDWAFKIPGLFGWDLKAKKATIFDGGETEYEVTNVAQIGRSVVAVLAPEHLEETKNKYVYVNSFTLTQNKILGTLERLTGAKFEVESAETEELAKFGLEKLRASKGGEEGVAYKDGDFEVITAAIYGHGGFNNFSRTRGLWNERLGLPVEDFEETMVRIVRESA
ncbi:hypothetical protein G7Y89_g10587 [Cudoniella acicularis]|uniref:NmrA-like domain-containing protein n=1 Tax=Cudoniella acicularis TaxID=354080 RepID=A0A8H4VYW1_9HELO|nr:hypothetical protein G7Y89_g10587 [Cudoniella acicularis]